ncbi:hypothetical protein HJ01_03549 [Flavobacterium frigoris PS1]|uniref:Uncharacterized protein n=1 Tax=Flavobacterium frigoris (strain PS1) TaxID=1086011 RepID=H7FWK2_FLAFP|nr:hypothetical protein HJ01_03549 [Flavobacterium frigoris PS1]
MKPKKSKIHTWEVKCQNAVLLKKNYKYNNRSPNKEEEKLYL